MLQVQQALALLYAKVVRRTCTGSLPLPNHPLEMPVSEISMYETNPMYHLSTQKCKTKYIMRRLNIINAKCIIFYILCLDSKRKK